MILTTFKINLPPPLWYKKYSELKTSSQIPQGKERQVNQLLIEVAKAVLITLITTLATIAVEKIREHNSSKRLEDDDYQYRQPYHDEFEHEHW